MIIGKSLLFSAFENNNLFFFSIQPRSKYNGTWFNNGTIVPCVDKQNSNTNRTNRALYSVNKFSLVAFYKQSPLIICHLNGIIYLFNIHNCILIGWKICIIHCDGARCSIHFCVHVLYFIDWHSPELLSKIILFHSSYRFCCNFVLLFHFDEHIVFAGMSGHFINRLK